MNHGLPVIGMDPSLNNWGLAQGWYDPNTDQLRIGTLDLINPEFTNAKQVRQNSKDIERATSLFRESLRIVENARAVFVEVPVGSQSARAMASYGICVGVLGALRARGIPFFEVTPTEVKMATVGKKTASKADIIQRAFDTYPTANWPTRTEQGRRVPVASKAEHMADAIGAIEAGIQLPTFRQFIHMFNVA